MKPKVKKTGTKPSRFSLFFVTEVIKGSPSGGPWTPAKDSMMKSTKVMLWIALFLAFVLTGCRSRQEAAGDKFRKGGDPINAVLQYEQALARGKVSKEFYKNYALVNIQLMDMRSKADPTAEFLDILRDTISSLLRAHPDPENEALYAQILQKIGTARINSGAEEGGFRFLLAADGLTNKPSGYDAQVDAIRKNFLATKLKEIEGDYEDASSEPTSGILADYKMNKLSLIFGGKEIPEMKGLWSKIRKLNLSTYLMYDYEGLITDGLDSRINKYGVLIAIVKMDKGPTSLKVQAKVFNGGSGAIDAHGDKFTLVDREGNVYKPSAKVAAFAKKDIINSRDESKTGGLTFNYPSGTEPWYIEYKSDVGVSRKYLP